MSKIQNEVLAANQTYASSFGDKGKLPMPPGRHFAILTCMDARLDPAVASLAEGDAHVIRNAGDDAIRSLVIAYKTARVDASGWHDAGGAPPKANTSAGSPSPIWSKALNG